MLAPNGKLELNALRDRLLRRTIQSQVRTILPVALLNLFSPSIYFYAVVYKIQAYGPEQHRGRLRHGAP